MKKKKFLSFTLVSVFSMTMLAACGGSTGTSKPEDAVIDYFTAWAEHDVDTMMSLIPNDIMTYLDEDYHLSEESLENLLDTKMTEFEERVDTDDYLKKIKDWKFEAKEATNTTYIREDSDYLGITLENAARVYVDDNNSYDVYKYDGKWYPGDLIEDIEMYLDADFEND